MLPAVKMNRINELARKSKTIGLTEAERMEQQQLRKEYIETFRNEFRKQLDSIQFVDEESADDKNIH